MLGISLAPLLGETDAEQAGSLAAVVVLLGLAPLAIGMAVFAWGIARLNEAGRSALRRPID